MPWFATIRHVVAVRGVVGRCRFRSHLQECLHPLLIRPTAAPQWGSLTPSTLLRWSGLSCFAPALLSGKSNNTRFPSRPLSCEIYRNSRHKWVCLPDMRFGSARRLLRVALDLCQDWRVDCMMGSWEITPGQRGLAGCRVNKKFRKYRALPIELNGIRKKTFLPLNPISIYKLLFIF